MYLNISDLLSHHWHRDGNVLQKARKKKVSTPNLANRQIFFQRPRPPQLREFIEDDQESNLPR